MTSVLAGQYTLKLGHGIEGTRPILCASVLDRLSQGRSLSALHTTLPALFTLCAPAHRLAIELLQQSQQSRSETPHALSPSQAQTLRYATLREHTQRFALDWPRMLPSPPHEHKINLPNWLQCPLLRPNTQGTNADWLHERLHIGAHWHDSAVRQEPGWQAWWAWLEQTLPSFADARQASPTATALALKHLPSVAELALADPDYALQPHLHQHSMETGPWTRTQWRTSTDTGHSIDHSGCYTGLGRLYSRYQDFCALLSDDQAQHLQAGATALGEDTHIAWVEMSRGLLIHLVQTEAGSDTVSRYRIIAPTEWNFHPQGHLAKLAVANPNMGRTLARAWIAAFDPCTHCEIVLPQVELELQEQPCTN